MTQSPTPRVITLPAGATVFFAPMVPQPQNVPSDWFSRNGYSYSQQQLMERWKEPYAPGDVLAVGEEFYSDMSGGRHDDLYFKADVGKVTPPRGEDYCYSWRPAWQLPAELCRKFVTVVSVTPVELAAVTAKDIDELVWKANPKYRSDVCIWRDCPTALARLRREAFTDHWRTTHPDHADDQHAWRVAVEPKGE